MLNIKFEVLQINLENDFIDELHNCVVNAFKNLVKYSTNDFSKADANLGTLDNNYGC